MQENVSYHLELVALAESLHLSHATAKNIITALSIPTTTSVVFLLSVPATLKTMLLRAACLLVYTPTNEHFGIVPLEAMLAGVPVLATSSGGPLETVVEGQTGWLRDAGRVEEWIEVMRDVVGRMGDGEREEMGRKGQKRVREEFSRGKMGVRLREEIDGMVEAPRAETVELQDLLLLLGMAAIVPVALGFALYLRFRD